MIYYYKYFYILFYIILIEVEYATFIRIIYIIVPCFLFSCHSKIYSKNFLGPQWAKRKHWLWTTFRLEGCENICACGPHSVAVFVPVLVLVLVSASASWLLLSYSCERARLYSNCFTWFFHISFALTNLAD